MRPEPGQLLHFSEDPTITRFVPHVAATAQQPEAYVWAVDTARSPDYWFPRKCPRAMAWVTPSDRRGPRTHSRPRRRRPGARHRIRLARRAAHGQSVRVSVSSSRLHTVRRARAARSRGVQASRTTRAGRAGRQPASATRRVRHPTSPVEQPMVILGCRDHQHSRLQRNPATQCQTTPLTYMQRRGDRQSGIIQPTGTATLNSVDYGRVGADEGREHRQPNGRAPGLYRCDSRVLGVSALAQVDAPIALRSASSAPVGAPPGGS